MAKSSEVQIKFTGDSASLQKASNQAASSVSKVGKDAEASAKQTEKAWAGAGAMVGLAAATIAVGLFNAGKAATEAALEHQRAFTNLDAVFGSSSATIKDWSKSAAKAYGLSSTQYSQLASNMAGSLKDMKLSTEDLTTTVGNLIARGADIGAKFGVPTVTAVEAIQKAMEGSYDPINKLGGKLDDASIAAYAAAHGIGSAGEKMTDAQKSAAILGKIMEDTKGSVGSWAEKADTASSKTQTLQSQIDNTTSSIGEKLMPAWLEMLKGFDSFIRQVSDMGAAKAGWDDFVSSFDGGIADMSGGVSGLIGQLAVDFVKSLWDAKSSTATNIGEMIVNFAGVSPAVQAALSGIPGIFDSIFSTAVGFVKHQIQMAIDAVNGLIHLINNIPGVNIPSIPSLPKHHSGGIVAGGAGQEVMTMLQAGERVIPRNYAGDSGGGGTLQVSGTGGLADLINQMVRTGQIRLAR